MRGDHLESLLAILPNAVVVVDKKLGLKRLNRPATQWLGLEDRDLADVAPTDWLTEASAAALRSQFDGGAIDSSSHDIELVPLEGARRFANVIVTVVEVDALERVLMNLRDTTAENREAARRAIAFRRLQEAILTRNIGIYEHDHLTDEIYGSSVVRAQYGLTATEALSIASFAGGMHPDDAPFVVREIAKSHDPNGTGKFDVELRIVTPGGELRWLHTCATSYFERNPKGERHVVRTTGSVRDITERVRAEQGVQRLAAIMDATPDLVATTDLDGRLTYLNGAGRRLTGLEEDEAIAERSVMTVIAAGTREQFEKVVIPAAIEDGLWKGDMQVVTPEGPAPVSLVLLAHRETRSRGAYLSMIARDLRHERELENQLRHSQRLEAVGRLAGGVAHDFNNMLSVIMVSTYLAGGEDGLPEGVRENLDEILHASERAANLTSQLLSFSRKQVIQPHVFNVDDLLQSTEPMLRRLVGEHIELLYAGSSGQALIKTDPQQLEQVMMNLVVNARDAMADGGRVTIEVDNVMLGEDYAAAHIDVVSGAHVSISVSDTGEGMDAPTRAKIFEPFFTTKERGKGTGLGLSTVFGIVKQSGGHIDVFSELGHGTTFRLYFPRTTEPAKAHSIRPAVVQAADDKTILIVEDEPSLRRVIVTILAQLGYRPVATSGAVEALELARADGGERIALILTDIVMPQMSGTQLADTLRDEGVPIPVLYMSGYTEDTIWQDGVLDATVNFIAKPITPSKLTSAVAEILATPA